MKKKYGFIIMGDYDTEKDIARFESGDMITIIYTVRDMDEAKKLVVKMKDEGVGAIETCGAFSKDDIDELASLLDNKLGIARVVSTDDQKVLLSKFFQD